MEMREQLGSPDGRREKGRSFECAHATSGGGVPKTAEAAGSSGGQSSRKKNGPAEGTQEATQADKENEMPTLSDPKRRSEKNESKSSKKRESGAKNSVAKKKSGCPFEVLNGDAAGVTENIKRGQAGQQHQIGRLHSGTEDFPKTPGRNAPLMHMISGGLPRDDLQNSDGLWRRWIAAIH